MWWEQRRSYVFGGMSGRVEMSELRRTMIDEVEEVLKEFVVAYGGLTRFVGGLGRGGWPEYFPEEWTERWPVLEGLQWIVWAKERIAGEEEGPFHRTSGAVIGGPEEN